jgi:hypothetical protein
VGKFIIADLANFRSSFRTIIFEERYVPASSLPIYFKTKLGQIVCKYGSTSKISQMTEDDIKLATLQHLYC